MWPNTVTYWPALGGLLQDHLKILRDVIAKWSPLSRSPRTCVPHPTLVPLRFGLPGNPHPLRKPAGTQSYSWSLGLNVLSWMSFPIHLPSYTSALKGAVLELCFILKPLVATLINTILTFGLTCSMDAPNTIIFSHFYFPWDLDKAPW